VEDVELTVRVDPRKCDHGGDPNLMEHNASPSLVKFIATVFQQIAQNPDE
jgi:hypothetical protein